MSYDVRVTDVAKNDLDEIIKYITETLQNRTAATSLLDDFTKQVSFLADSPYMFPACADNRLQKHGYRRFLFKKNYVALYLIDDDKKIVNIMHIFYAKRDYAKLI